MPELSGEHDPFDDAVGSRHFINGAGYYDEAGTSQQGSVEASTPGTIEPGDTTVSGEFPQPEAPTL